MGCAHSGRHGLCTELAKTMTTTGRFEPELREALQVYSARVRATVRGSDRYDQQGGWVETLLPLGLLRCTICSHVSVGVGGLVGWI